MPIKDVFLNLFKELLIERPARKLSIEELATKLHDSGKTLSVRFAGILNLDANRITLRHIIGLEKWIQKRLSVFTGQDLIVEEYDHYRPDESQSWNDLRDAFARTRAESVVLARHLQNAEPDETATVPHNDFGEMTLKGWLYYMNAHANRESKRVR